MQNIKSTKKIVVEFMMKFLNIEPTKNMKMVLLPYLKPAMHGIAEGIKRVRRVVGCYEMVEASISVSKLCVYLKDIKGKGLPLGG